MAKKSVSIPARRPPPTPAAVDALCSLLSSYLDLNVPPPQALLDLRPEDAFAAGSAKSAPAPRWLVPTCFSPLYSAGTPLASMRKLGPVAWQTVAQGLAGQTGIPPKAARELIHEIITQFAPKKAAPPGAALKLK